MSHNNEVMRQIPEALLQRIAKDYTGQRCWDSLEPDRLAAVDELRALLALPEPATSQPTFVDLIEDAEEEIKRVAAERGVAVDKVYPTNLTLRNATATIQALMHAANIRRASAQYGGHTPEVYVGTDNDAVGTFDPGAAGGIRWKEGFVRGDFNEGDPIFCRSSVKKLPGPTTS